MARPNNRTGKRRQHSRGKGRRKADPKARSQRRLLLRVLIVLGLLILLPPTGAWVWVESRAAGRVAQRLDQVRPARVALVLGTSPQQVGGGPNSFFENRMDATAALWHSGKVEVVLVSGDNRVANYNEVAAMRRALVSRGVPQESIRGDAGGLRTLDSVVRAHEVFGADEVVVVSQHFHVARAIAIARHEGIEARGYAAEDVEILAMARTLLREVGARLKMIADLYWLDTEPSLKQTRLGRSGAARIDRHFLPS